MEVDRAAGEVALVCSNRSITTANRDWNSREYCVSCLPLATALNAVEMPMSESVSLCALLYQRRDARAERMQHSLRGALSQRHQFHGRQHLVLRPTPTHRSASTPRLDAPACTRERERTWHAIRRAECLPR